MMQPPPPRDPKLRMGLTIGNAQPLTTPAWVARGPAVEDPHFPSRAKPSPRRGGASPTAETPAHTGEASPQLMPPLAYSTHNPLPTHGRRPARRKQPSEEQWWRWDEPEDAPLAPIKKGPAAARAQAPLGREEPLPRIERPGAALQTSSSRERHLRSPTPPQVPSEGGRRRAPEAQPARRLAPMSGDDPPRRAASFADELPAERAAERAPRRRAPRGGRTRAAARLAPLRDGPTPNRRPDEVTLKPLIACHDQTDTIGAARTPGRPARRAAADGPAGHEHFLAARDQRRMLVRILQNDF